MAYYSGKITAFLMDGELKGNYSNTGIYIKNFKSSQQINIDFIDKHGLGGPHIDFQPAEFGGEKYEKLFLEGLLDGLSEAGE